MVHPPEPRHSVPGSKTSNNGISRTSSATPETAYRCAIRLHGWSWCPGLDIVTTGADAMHAGVAAALYERAVAVLSTTGGLGGFDPMNESETFDVEYWPLELYKLGLLPPPKELAGQVAPVTGGASGIGRAIALRFGRSGCPLVRAVGTAVGDDYWRVTW